MCLSLVVVVVVVVVLEIALEIVVVVVVVLEIVVVLVLVVAVAVFIATAEFSASSSLPLPHSHSLSPASSILHHGGTGGSLPNRRATQIIPERSYAPDDRHLMPRRSNNNSTKHTRTIHGEANEAKSETKMKIKIALQYEKRR